MSEYGTDYDLAILGGSTVSRRVALQASRKGARVALLAPHWQVNNAVECSFHTLRRSYLHQTGDWSYACAWFDGLCKHRSLSPTMLRSEGIDVIVDSASFTQDRYLQIGDRHLRASRYLLTDGYAFAPSLEEGMLCHQLMQLNVLPKIIYIIGSGASVAEWAYGLSHFARVTVLCDAQTLLPAEDLDIQRLVEAQLRTVGITIDFLDSSSDLKSIQTAMVGENPLLATVAQTEINRSLNLEYLGISSEATIVVDRYLRTQFPQFYATGSCLGGEHRSALTQQETDLALNNALFDRYQQMSYAGVSYSIDGLSSVGRWGLTERQAERRYGSRTRVFQASCLPVEAEHSAEINFCKLITLEKRIIGIHLLGKGASELAKCLGQCLTMPKLAKWVVGHVRTGTVYGAIYTAIAQWENGHWQAGQWRRDWAENWFNWRRSW